ncbi:ABC transporter substrate-binding protein [Alishewanella sp. HL-SH06]|uniref:ABC transporter substrate-binding protein n=1 Tax=Alishewanella sp. HL-SH06 TaxID=3461144 RepID=UPI00404143F3
MRFFCVVLCCFCFSKMASANESLANTLQWAINDAPPFHIIDGPYQGLGLCDGLMDAVHRALPDKQRSVWLMPQARISNLLKQQSELCFPCMIYHGRHDERAYFSLPTHVYYPYQLITTKAKAAQIQLRYGNPLAFTALLADKHYRLGYPAGRRYSILQPLLDKTPPFLARTGSGGAIAILQMIVADRLDYTMDYPIIANYFHKVFDSELTLTPLQENDQTHMPGAIGCAKTAWGQAVLAEINAVMPQIRQDPAFLNVLELWAGQDPAAYLEFNKRHLANPAYNVSPLQP